MIHIPVYVDIRSTTMLTHPMTFTSIGFCSALNGKQASVQDANCHVISKRCFGPTFH